VDDVRRVPAEALEAFSTDVLSRVGMPDRDARIVGASLIHADLIGVSTHGVARLPSYVERLQRGLVNPNPRIEVETRHPWSAAINADNAMGVVAGMRAVEIVREMAGTVGIGAAVVRGSNHFGTAGYYARLMSGEDSVGFCLSPASKSLAPFGSREPLFGTNPFALSVPAGRYDPWTMDMASSVAARGHIRIAARNGTPIPEGWALDAEGRETTDAQRALHGVMLPFAGPKGSALAMMVDILGGVMSGSGFAGSIRDMNFDFEAPQDVGHFFLAWKIDAFLPLAQFTERMETLIGRMKALKPAAGADEVKYPGEIEAAAMRARRVQGIPIGAAVLASLRDLGRAHDVAFPDDAARTAG
jgi:LDH2 family malate/lactate/ureidoglycolate dehydrogenase